MATIPIEQIKAFYQTRKKIPQNLPLKIQNRRYKKLQELIEEGDFFSEESIIRREPILYYLYIGRYLREPRP